MNRAVCLTLAALLMLTGLTAGAAAATSSAAASGPTSLSVSPGNGQFTAGQELTMTGSIGRAGKRTVVLQSNMGRPGDIWRDVPGARARTNPAGAFTIRTRAPSMMGILYRVASGSARTPVWTSQVRHQDVLLRADHAVAGEPFTLTADTTTMPLLTGRGLTLQQRVGTGWSNVASTTLGADGLGRFTVTAGAPATVVYRVRLEDWNVGTGHVGWFPSYPLYVDVAAPGTRQRGETLTRTATRSTASTASTRAAAPYQTTAGRTYRWGTPRFDFDWEVGESLTDKATLGTRRRGWWLDASDGTGRVALRNGAMQLSSQPEGPLNDSRGSMSATLQRNTQAYGRWETRVMPMTFQDRSADYRILAELVPADPAQQRCGGQNITILDMSPARSEVVVGAKALSGAHWTRTVGGVTVRNAFHAFAVEVTPKKITWFIDGKPVGKVADPAAVSGVPMTVRVSMVGAADRSMTTTRTLVDWVRAWGTGTGTRTKGGAALTRGTHTTTC